MIKIYSYLLFFTLAIIYAPLMGQQYITEKMVELTAAQPEVKAYFSAHPTIFILSNEWVNAENCRINQLSTSKVLLLMEEEELNLRKHKTWMEFNLIKRKQTEATVKIKLYDKVDVEDKARKEFEQKDKSLTFKFERQAGIWRLKE